MGQTKHIFSVRTLVLSVLFLFYYGMMALICWAIVLANPEEINRWFTDIKGVGIFLIFSGFTASSLLFILRFPLTENHFKWYWAKRDWFGLYTTCIDFIINFLLVAYPFLLFRFALPLTQRFGVHCVLLCVLVSVIYLTWHRVRRKAIAVGISI